LPWAQAFEFDSLGKLIDWAGKKLKRSRVDKEWAAKRMIDPCMGDFK